MGASTLSPPPTLPPRSRRRALWQFSLRELLLLTLVAALALTIWRMAPRRFVPTSFLSSHSLGRAVEEAEREVTGPKADPVSCSDVVQVVAGEPALEGLALKHVCICRFRQEKPPPKQFLAALQHRLKLQLADADCEVVDEGVTPEVKSPRFPSLGFYINYRQGPTRGLVSVDAARRGSDLEIYVLVHEFRGR